MCLAIPGKVLKVNKDSQPVMGDVSFGGITKRVCLEWIPEIREGEYVIVHVGFAISKMDEKEALETIELLKQMGEGLEELGDETIRPEDTP